MANPRQIAAQAAARYLPPQYRGFFMRQMDKESHFRDETSPVGAQGYGQWMPATARAHGVNPHDPVSAYNGSAKMMAGYLRSYHGSYAKALAAYNAGPAAVAHYGGIPPYSETRRYVREIMGGLGGAVEGAPSLPTLGQRLTNPAPAPRGPNLSALLAPDPGLSGILRAQGGTLGRISSVLDEPITLPRMPATATQGMPMPGALPSVTVGTQPGDARFAHLAPGADRAGVRTQAGVLRFVGKIGRMAGHPLTIGTGTEHSRMTVDGNVSDHWSGHAADIPATGAQLIHLGQLALIAAGMPRRQALKQRGGLYNVGGHQIIFNTHEGGDHTNHLHVSAH